MTVGILPNVNSLSLNQVVNSVISACFHTGRLNVKPAKKNRKRMGDKSAVASLKEARQVGYAFQDTDPPESLPISRQSRCVDTR